MTCAERRVFNSHFRISGTEREWWRHEHVQGFLYGGYVSVTGNGSYLYYGLCRNRVLYLNVLSVREFQHVVCADASGRIDRLRHALSALETQVGNARMPF